jgi:hypothetical protein
MGNTLWVLEENQSSDNWDHSTIIDKSKYLDKISIGLGFSKLSTYFDESILAKEFGIDMEPKYFNADILKEILSALLEELKNTVHTELINELKDILVKCTLAQEKNIRIRLAIVP